MEIALTSAQEKFILEQMRKHGDESPEAVISEGLRLIQLKEEYEKCSAELRAEIDLGMADIIAGRVINGPESIERIRKQLKERERQSN